MIITEVRIKLSAGGSKDTLRAFCRIVIDGEFAICDLKVIEGPSGLFVAMPSKRVTARCRSCGWKTFVGLPYCGRCGEENPVIDKDIARDERGRQKIHADICHPIRTDCREMLTKVVLKAYLEEAEKAKEPGYACSFGEYFAE